MKTLELQLITVGLDDGQQGMMEIVRKQMYECMSTVQ